MPDEQQVAPVQPVPPHWPYRAEQPVVLLLVCDEDAEVVVVVPPELVLLSLLLTKARAAAPYSVPYPWCTLASLPVQQYGSAESQ